MHLFYRENSRKLPRSLPGFLRTCVGNLPSICRQLNKKCLSKSQTQLRVGQSGIVEILENTFKNARPTKHLQINTKTHETIGAPYRFICFYMVLYLFLYIFRMLLYPEIFSDISTSPDRPTRTQLDLGIPRVGFSHVFPPGSETWHSSTSASDSS